MGKANVHKKTRQIFRREVRAEVRKYVRTHLQAIKPKPKWIPQFVWNRLLLLVLDFKKLVIDDDLSTDDK